MAEISNPKLLGGLKELWSNSELVDVTLSADGKEFHCHRVILAATSAYFRAMFNNDLTEKATRVIPLPLIDASTLATILVYIYTAKINIDCENAQSIFTAASIFLMPELQMQCASFMAEELHLSNCLSMYKFASLHHCPQLEEPTRRFCIQHFKDLLDDEDLMRLDCSELVKLLQSDELNVKQEEDVARTILKWLEWDISCREPSSELLLCLRLPLLSESFIKSKLHTNEILMNKVEFHTMLDDQQLLKDEMNVEDLRRLGMYSRQMLVFVSGGMDSVNRSMACYDPESKKNYWALPMHSSFDFQHKIDYHRITVSSRNEIFLSGGVMYQDYIAEDFTPAQGTLHYFNPHKVCWESMPNMICGRCAHGFVIVDRMLYVLGGKSRFPKGKPLASVHRYDIEDGTWEIVSPMPLPLFHHAVVVHQNKILVLGGITTNQIRDSDGNRNVLNAVDDDEEMVSRVCFECDVDSGVWTRLSGAGERMHMPRCQFGATVCRGELYVIGGCNGQHKLSTVEVYDFQRKKWRFGTDFPEDRKSTRAISLDNCVYVCGGVRSIISRQDQTPRVVEARDLWKYDPESNRWNQEVRLVQYANIHACAVADMNTKKLNPSEFVCRRAVLYSLSDGSLGDTADQ